MAKETQQTAVPPVSIDERLLKAISHPLRYRLLLQLEGRVASPKELAEELGQPLGRVSHHVRRLRRLGAIELVRTEPRRGATEHYYRARVLPYFSDDDWARLPPSTRRAIVAPTLERILRDVHDAAQEGGFDHPRIWAGYHRVELDADAMQEVSELLDATLARVMEISAEVAGRQIAQGAGPSPLATELALLHFLRAPRAR
jgi:DNA-binding transcriptional ArsR family regulator